MDSEGESSRMKPKLPWARLVSCNVMHPDIEIKEDDVTFDSSDMGVQSNATQNSCKIYRNVGLGIVKLQNLSSCGMLINGHLLGKDEQISLENGNEIIFGSERNGRPTYHFNLTCGDQQGKSEKVSSLVDNMKCGICLNIWCDVVSITPCLHNFCNTCLSAWYKRSEQKGIKCICPQCRSDIYSVGCNHSLRNIVEDILKDYSSSQCSAEESSQLDKHAIVQSGNMIIGRRVGFHLNLSEFFESNESDDESFAYGIGAQCPQCVPSQGSVGEGFHCVRESGHLTCQSCWGLMPLRTDISVPQMCLGCRKVLCNAYWESQRAVNSGSQFNIQCNNDALLPILRRTFSDIPEETHGGNTVEQDITRRCIHDQSKTVSEIVQELHLKLDAGEIEQPRLPANPTDQITSATPLCKSLVAIRDKFKTFEREWKDFLPIKDLAIARLQVVIGLSERYFERTKLVDEGGMSTVESWYVALTIRLRIIQEIWNEIAHHSPSVDTSISAMRSNVGVALDFEDIKEENVNETKFGSRLNELGKVAIKKKHLCTLASLGAFIGYVKEYEKDHEKTVQAVSNMINSAELKIKHTPCPPMNLVNNRLAKFIALAKKMKEKGRIILEDHLM